MRSIHHYLIVLGLGLVLAACDQSSTTSPKGDDGSDPLVAMVNDTRIYQSDIEAYYESLPPEYRQMPIGFVQEQLVDRVIDQALMVEAGRKAGLEDDERYVKELETTRIRLLQDFWILDNVEAQLTDERLRSVYDESIQDFVPEPEIQARHVLVETEDEAKAIIAELDQGATFNDLARDKSTGPSAERGGDLGYFTSGTMVPSFSEAAFALNVGEYTKIPVQSQFGWHVIKVEDKRDSAPPPFEDVKENIKQAEAGKVYTSLVEDLRTSAQIERVGADAPEGPLESDAEVEAETIQEPDADDDIDIDTDADASAVDEIGDAVEPETTE